MSLKFCTIKHHFGTGPMWPGDQPSPARTRVGHYQEWKKVEEVKNYLGFKSFRVVEE